MDTVFLSLTKVHRGFLNFFAFAAADFSELEVYVLYHECPLVSLISLKSTSIPSDSNNFFCIEICMYSGTKYIIYRHSAYFPVDRSTPS